MTDQDGLDRFATCTDQDSSSNELVELPAAGTQTEWLPTSALLPADSPRLDGEDAEHTKMLAESGAKLPPVIVHRDTMRVIDGMHRLGAAMLRGDELIEVRFFEGSAQEAFVLAVKANIAHGRPLSLADRTTAAERIIQDNPTWSDRSIAAAVGLGARTVGTIRRRCVAASDNQDAPKVRVGRDGRVRPVDNTEGRAKAAEFIKNQPEASLREIAKSAGVSPTTARDVRNRIQCGIDPVQVRGARKPASTNHTNLPVARTVRPHALATMLYGLQRDPSLRFNESGRTVLRWVLTRAAHYEEWRKISGDVPTHCAFILADVARRLADEWNHIAEELDKRTQQAISA